MNIPYRTEKPIITKKHQSQKVDAFLYTLLHIPSKNTPSSPILRKASSLFTHPSPFLRRKLSYFLRNSGKKEKRSGFLLESSLKFGGYFSKFAGHFLKLVAYFQPRRDYFHWELEKFPK